MSSKSASQELTGLQKVGIYVFVLFCGIPAAEINYSTLGIPFSLPSALACATVGGAVGGLLLCPRPILAGLIGGLIAGPPGLVAVYYYTQYRDPFGMEFAIVQGIACLPGLAIGFLLKMVLSGQQDIDSIGMD